jgi:hypothetical protein
MRARRPPILTTGGGNSLAPVDGRRAEGRISQARSGWLAGTLARWLTGGQDEEREEGERERGTRNSQPPLLLRYRGCSMVDDDLA